MAHLPVRMALPFVSLATYSRTRNPKVSGASVPIEQILSNYFAV
jgi:hypothetical protein